MKVTLTKISFAPESSAPETITRDAKKGDTVGDFVENALKQEPFGGDIKGYEVYVQYNVKLWHISGPIQYGVLQQFSNGIIDIINMFDSVLDRY